MIKLDFLEASDGTPLTKTFTKNAKTGAISVEPYPMVKRLNSCRVEVTSCKELYEALNSHAAQHRCLLKGNLKKQPLKNESRAGLTTAEEPTQFIVLDLDFETGWNSIDEFLADLNPAWADVSYVFQHSSSAGVTKAPGLRGHIFLLLDKPIVPSLLKEWLRDQNLSLNGLHTQLTLAANGMTLKWPLDISTCQNDKLIYIAPPRCFNVPDSIGAGSRIVYKKKTIEFAPAPVVTTSPASIDAEVEKAIIRLRDKAGLPKRKAKLKNQGALNLLTNPDTAVITDTKEARGFVYVNLNGGDSWAYYFPANNPDILYNFKGEPLVRTRDIAPDFYADYRQQLANVEYGNVTPYVFREPRRDAYYNILYNKDTDQLDLCSQAGSTQKLSDFMAQYGQVCPDPIHDWTVEFDPRKTEVIKPYDKWVNLFRPTSFIRTAKDCDFGSDVPPIIRKVIWSLTGNDEESFWRFINWLAFLFQTREKIGTSWVFHGTYGTGKGILLNRILRPLLGDEHVVEFTTQNFEDEFNGQLERCLVLWLDEFQVASAKNADTVMNKLRNYITEPRINIRGMRQQGFNTQSFMNVIVATNHSDPVRLAPNERRFNVAPAQERALKITHSEVDMIKEELISFAGYLWHFDVNENNARRVMENAARDQMIVASQTSMDSFFQALRSGNMDYFLMYLSESMPLDNTLLYAQFEKIMLRWCTEGLAREGDQIVVSRDEVMAAYAYIIGAGMTPAKFSRICSIHRLRASTQITKSDNKRVRGFAIPFDGDVDAISDFVKNGKATPHLSLVEGNKS